MEVVQPEGRNSDLHTFSYPQLWTPHHPWDGVTTGVHLEAKRSFPTGPLWPHCAFVPQWDPLPLQSPANHLLQRQSHLCRPRVNFVWRRCEMHTARTPSMQAVTFPLLLLQKHVTMLQFCLRSERICAKNINILSFHFCVLMNLMTWAANLKLSFFTFNLHL